LRINVNMIAAFDELYTRFSNAPAAARAAAMRTMEGVAEYLWGRVRQNLSGSILKARTGRLRDSIQREVYEVNGMITARVFSDGTVPYSVIQEKGGVTRPHDIIVKNAQALRFQAGGKFLFRHSVHHPGSKIPEAMYLRRTMIQERANVTRMVREGMKGAI